MREQNCIILILLVSSSIHCIQPSIKVRPMRQVEFLTQSAKLIKPVIAATCEVNCALKCLDVEVCHLFKFEYNDSTCHMMRSVSGKPNLDKNGVVYTVFTKRSKLI